MLFKSDNISITTFTRGVCFNTDTENCNAYHEKISLLFPGLFVHSNISDDDLFSSKKKTSRNKIEEIRYSRKERMEQDFSEDMITDMFS